MTENVIISIKGKQLYEEQEPDGMELVTSGTLEVDPEGGYKLSYWESELTGMEGTRTSLTIEPMSVTMEREGTLNSRMVFEEGKKHLFLYDTPFGTTTMSVDTRHIISRLDEHGGDMELDYMIDFEHAPVSRNKFRINVREIGS